MYRLLQLVTLCAFLVSSPLLAQSYRGVQIGQRDDLLPPEFKQVKRGEYAAQFGPERMQVFANGALVTGFTVVPLIPLTLAEAVAKFGNASDVPRMLVLLDPDGDPQGIVDPVKRISYLTRSFGPDGIVSSIGYYDQNTALLIWTDNADATFLQDLQTAAKDVSLQNLNARPRLATVNSKAEYVMQQALKAASAEAHDLTSLLAHYQQICGGASVMDTACSETRRTQYPKLVQTAERFRFALKRADDVYATNAELFQNVMPGELSRLHETANKLLPQVPSIPRAAQ